MSTPPLFARRALSVLALGLNLLTSSASASTWVGHPTVKVADDARVTSAQLTVEEIVFETCDGDVVLVRPTGPLDLVVGALLPAPDGAICAVTFRVEAPLKLRLTSPGGRLRELQLDSNELRVELPEGVEADDQGQIWLGLSELGLFDLDVDGGRALWDQLAAAIVVA